MISLKTLKFQLIIQHTSESDSKKKKKTVHDELQK